MKTKICAAVLLLCAMCAQAQTNADALPFLTNVESLQYILFKKSTDKISKEMIERFEKKSNERAAAVAAHADIYIRVYYDGGNDILIRDIAKLPVNTEKAIRFRDEAIKALDTQISDKWESLVPHDQIDLKITSQEGAAMERLRDETYQKNHDADKRNFLLNNKELKQKLAKGGYTPEEFVDACLKNWVSYETIVRIAFNVEAERQITGAYHWAAFNTALARQIADVDSPIARELIKIADFGRHFAYTKLMDPAVLRRLAELRISDRKLLENIDRGMRVMIFDDHWTGIYMTTEDALEYINSNESDFRFRQFRQEHNGGGGRDTVINGSWMISLSNFFKDEPLLKASGIDLGALLNRLQADGRGVHGAVRVLTSLSIIKANGIELTIDNLRKCTVLYDKELELTGSSYQQVDEKTLKNRIAEVNLK
jgi:hypothetical protein